jgi:hypothetical protein
MRWFLGPESIGLMRKTSWKIRLTNRGRSRPKLLSVGRGGYILVSAVRCGRLLLRRETQHEDVS